MIGLARPALFESGRGSIAHACGLKQACAAAICRGLSRRTGPRLPAAAPGHCRAGLGVERRGRVADERRRATHAVPRETAAAPDDRRAARGTGARPRPRRPKLRPLVALLPYLGALSRAGAARRSCALLVAALATLVVPIAVRRMIDFGFSRESAQPDRQLFHRDDRGRWRARAGERGALLPRDHARRAHRRRSAQRRVRPSHRRCRSPIFDQAKTGEMISRLTADTTQIKAAVGSSVSVALRNLVLFVGAAAMMVVTSPRLSAFVLAAIPVIVLPLYGFGRAVRAALARGAGHARRRLRLCVRADRRRAHAAGLHQRDAGARPLRRRGRARLRGRGRIRPRARAMLTAIAIFLVFASVVVVLWVGAQDVMAGGITRRAAVAVRALRGVRRDRARPALRGLGRALAGRPAPPSGCSRSSTCGR